ncbi:hypothetical protein [Polymorphobacter megasporae]|uniref:hypothetical protein n=1 Tax=Glacieibacterium megasporae TaxID=2835787 RepID=UPI001C1E13BA|nr:hypothetical protein [Polymorphobacter megasporae]UAJ12708.1 hypothetical protein KTC28_19370 [Polymorphobacter megasporae]
MSIGDWKNPTYWLGIDAEGPDAAWLEHIRQGLRESSMRSRAYENLSCLETPPVIDVTNG